MLVPTIRSIFTAGVDDNGAAVVSMLEAIRQLTDTSGVQRRNTMVFVSFDIEEEGRCQRKTPFDYMREIDHYENNEKLNAFLYSRTHKCMHNILICADCCHLTSLTISGSGCLKHC